MSKKKPSAPYFFCEKDAETGETKSQPMTEGAAELLAEQATRLQAKLDPFGTAIRLSVGTEVINHVSNYELWIPLTEAASLYYDMRLRLGGSVPELESCQGIVLKAGDKDQFVQWGSRKKKRIERTSFVLWLTREEKELTDNPPKPRGLNTRKNRKA